MLSLIYSSIATRPFEASDLTALLAQSRASNERIRVTGVLLYRNGYFLQLLEGPDTAVRAKMRTIKDDARHTKVSVLLEDVVEARQFPEWTMGFPTIDEPSEIPGYRSTFDDLAVGDGDSLPSVPALRELMRWFTPHTS